jgi:hypothetical protein
VGRYRAVTGKKEEKAAIIKSIAEAHINATKRA